MSFPKQILIALFSIGCLGAYPLLKYGSADIIRASAMGAFLMTVNVLLGYAAVQYSFDKSTTTFVKYVLGGMGLRLFALAGILVLLIKIFGFDAAALVSSMGIFYVVFLTLEILFIQQKINLKQRN
jgi:hypothetical protein